MVNQMLSAKKRILTNEMKTIAKKEGINARKLMKSIAKGYTVILKNNSRNISGIAVGKNVRVKINTNIGTSPDFPDKKKEAEKARLAEKYGSDAIMDLSTSGNLTEIRKAIMNATLMPLGTVPIYEAAEKARKKHGSILDFNADILFNTIRQQLREGIDFITVHSGINQNIMVKYSTKKRITGIVSRGGALIAKWLQLTKEENPLNKEFDYLLEIAKEFDVTLSLGDGLRPGAIADASDYFQLAELKELGRQVKLARKQNVMTMVEGPGHIPLNEIKKNVQLEKKYCYNAPFYVLGPLPTDVGMAYDHITAAIGGTIAAMHGADMLCYVTPAEHLGFPTIEDVIDGIIATKIAAHSVNITRFKKDKERDLAVSKARAAFEWHKMFSLAFNPQKAKQIHYSRPSKTAYACSMCGDYCPMRLELSERKKR